MSKSAAFLVGCDPEMFYKDKDGKFVSAHDILPGTKLEPFPVELGAIQVDGVAAEFNITPAKDSREFINNIQQVITKLSSYSTLTLSAEPFAVFEPTYFKSLPDEVRELGCNPDFNAYTGLVNPSPDGDSTTMRTASGHLHIGWCKDVNPHDKIHFKDCCTFIKQLDYFLGLYSLMWDGDNTRRQLYGRAGAFRPKSYGAEYRVLSNVWLRSSNLQAWIFDAIQSAKENLFQNPSMESRFGDFAQKCINDNVTDWITTVKGRKVHEAMQMPLPDIRGITSTAPVKKIPIGDYIGKLKNLQKKVSVEV